MQKKGIKDSQMKIAGVNTLHKNFCDTAEKTMTDIKSSVATLRQDTATEFQNQKEFLQKIQLEHNQQSRDI